MNWIIATALRFRVIVIALAILLMIAGQQIIPRMPLDVFPEFAPPLVEIQTEAPGLSAAEVESLVTVPLENAVNGTSWLETIRSKSVLGLSSIRLIFEDGVDLMQARQLVAERLSQTSGLLPEVARPPVILSPLSSTSRVLKIGLWSERLSQMEISELARWTIRPRLMAVPGVANVAIWGQRDRQVQVLVDPDRLRAHDISLDQVVQASRDAAAVGGGGFLDTPTQRLPVTQRGPISSAEDLARMTLAFRGGAALRLGDATDVVEGFPPPIGDAIINDVPGILLIVEKQPWGNTLQVTREVEAALEALRPGLSDIEVDSTIFRPATFIEMSLRNLERALLIGCVLIIAVLAFFLNHWRTALISVLAIPLSLVAAVLVLYVRGMAIDTMVLAGLIVALGEVVDDAIIDVENITRRLRLNRAAGSPDSSMGVVLKASLEVRSAVVYASLIIVLLLVPVLLLGGLAGSFFQPLALAYILAIGASLCVALTLTPALSLMLLPSAVEHQSEPRFLRALKARYERLLPSLLASRGSLSILLAGMVGLSAASLPLLGQELLPKFKEYDFLMHWVEKPGTSIEAMDRITVRASRELRAIPGVRNFGSHIGRAEVADEVVGPNFTELWISLDPEVDYEPTVAVIQEVVDGYPGLYRDLLTYLRERIKEVLTGTSATLVVRVYGSDLARLRSHAVDVKAAMQKVEGVRDLKVEPQVLVPQVEVNFLPEAAGRFGLSAGQVRDAVATLVKGTKVGEFYRDQKIFDIVVWGRPEIRQDVESLRSIRIDTPTGAQVPLSAVADVQVRPTPNVISREGGSRRIDVSCNVSDRDLGAVTRDVEAAVRSLEFDRGDHPEVLGEYAELERASRRLAGLVLLCGIGVFLLLHADFGSVRLAFIVLVTLPFALVGSLVAAFSSGGVLSLGSLVGFVTVLGIAARNALMLLSHYRHLRAEEGMDFGPALVVRGAVERLSPILMTALTTGLALVPIAVAGNLPGHEIEHPMAVVILGGLLTSTLLNLLFLPALYLRWGRST